MSLLLFIACLNEIQNVTLLSKESFFKFLLLNTSFKCFYKRSKYDQICQTFTMDINAVWRLFFFSEKLFKVKMSILTHLKNTL